MNESARDAATDAILKKLERENAALRQDRDNLERLLAERSELLHLTSFALNQVREAAYLLNEAGRLVYANEEACRTRDYSMPNCCRWGWRISIRNGLPIDGTRHGRCCARRERSLSRLRIAAGTAACCRSRSTPAISNMTVRSTTWRSRAMSPSASVQSSR